MRLFATLLLLYPLHLIHAQNFLLLKNGHDRIAVVYDLEDEIRLQLKGEDGFISGYITHVGLDHFEVDGNRVMLDHVSRFDVRDKPHFNFNFDASANVLLIAAVVLPAAEVYNRGIEDFEGPSSIDGTIIKVSASLILGGLLMKMLRPKYFKPGHTKKAVIISNVQIAHH